MSALGDLPRFARTVAQLHPLQIAMRLPHLAVARSLAFVPRVFAPASRSPFGSAPAALIALAEAERTRGRERLARLPAGRLRDYEAAYGLDLGAAGTIDDRARAAWRSRVAIEPFPASVRARRIAVALRAGSPSRTLAGELARACRAVVLQPELHLLGNHLLENAFALTCGGAVTRGPEADAWHRVGAALLDWQLGEQFGSDGGHFEGSASYHVALLHGLLETIELTRAGGRPVPAAWIATAARGAEWLRAVRAPDGTYPLFNDAALDAAPAVDLVLALAESMRVIGAAESADERAASARHLASTGWVILRQPGGVMLALDAGADGASYQPGHVHADALTIELWVRGERVIVDYGVASYANDAARAESRATRSHNTVELEGLDSSEVWSAFRVGRRAHAALTELREEPHADGTATLIAEAEHDGYRFLPGRPKHVRRVSLEPRALVVHDRITLADEPPAQQTRLVNRLRLAAVANAPRVAMDGRTTTDTAHPEWFPRHGERRAATVYERRDAVGRGYDDAWRVDW